MQSSPGFPNDDIDISPKYETLLQIINHLMRDQDVYDTNQKGRKNTSNHHDKSHREFEEVPPSFVLLAQAVEVKESSDKDGPTDNLVEHHRPSLALGLDENRQVNEGQDVEGSMLPNSQRTRMQTSNNIRDQSEGNAPQDEFNDLNDLALTSISVEQEVADDLEIQSKPEDASDQLECGISFNPEESLSEFPDDVICDEYSVDGGVLERVTHGDNGHVREAPDDDTENAHSLIEFSLGSGLSEAL